MRFKVGDKVEFLHGLGGAYVRQGVVKRIEAQVGVSEAQGILEACEVQEWDSDNQVQGAFVDLEDGRWTYGARVVRVLAGE